MMKIRLANKKDVAAIQKIYAYYVYNSTATFAYEAFDEDTWRLKLDALQSKYPFLVCELDEGVAGYAYASGFRDKEAYMWDVELSIYVDPAYTKQHIGSALMKQLLAILKLQHFQKAYSCITIPNEASVVMHQHQGFEITGTFKRTGYKLGQWLDVLWMEYVLCDTEVPVSPIAIKELNPGDMNL